jgi:hypothetical protein
VPGETVRLLSSRGDVVEAPAKDVDTYLGRGYTIDSEAAGLDRATAAGLDERYSGIGNKLDAGIAGVARGATFGLSDVAAGALGGGEYLSNIREYNPITSGISEVAGSILPAFAAPGSLAASTPAGLAARAGSSIAKAGEGASALAKVSGAVAGGALEGAAQNAGSYISDVALGDRDLSAEGFLGAMKDGALWGGAGGGAFAVGEGALVKVRNLFAANQATREAVETASRTAKQAIDDAARDGETMAQQARDAINQRREALAASDAEVRLATNQAKIAAAQSRATVAEAKVGQAAELHAAKMAKLEAAPVPAGKAPRKGRKAMQPKGEIAAESGPADDLMAQLEGTQTGLNQGATLGELSAVGRPAPGPRGPMGDIGQDVRAVEDAMNDAAAQFDPEMAKLVQAERAHRESTEALNSWRKTKEEVRGYASDLKKTAASSGQRRAVDEGVVSNVVHSVGVGRRSTSKTVNRTLSEADRELVRKMSPEEFAVFREHFDGGQLAGRRVAADDIGNGRRGLVDQDTGEVLRTVDRGTQVLDTARENAVMRATGDIDELATILNRIHEGRPMAVVSGIDEAVAKALRGPVEHAGMDIAGDAKVLHGYEQTSADLSDALGMVAPRGAVQRAAEFRTAVGAVEQKEGRRIAEFSENLSKDAASDIARDAAENPPPRPSLYESDYGTRKATEMIRLEPSLVTPPPKAAGLGSTVKDVLGGGRASSLADIGAALEGLSMAGIPGLPSAQDIPVIGPILSMYLKARALSLVSRRLGGKVGASAETKIAGKAAETKQRVLKAVGKMLDVGVAGARRTAPAAPLAASILGHRLFAVKDGDTVLKAPANANEGQRALIDRLAELAAATRPGAVEAAVRARIPSTDPTIVDAITSATQRRLDFLSEKAPRPPAPAGIFASSAWAPTPAQVSQFARYVRAVNDPAGVLENAADGGAVTLEDVEALRTVYPRMYADAQQQLMTQAINKPTALPYARRVALSVLFNVPLDGTMSPEYVSAMQDTFQATSPDEAQPAQPGQPPVPSIAANINIASRVSPDAGRRAVSF